MAEEKEDIKLAAEWWGHATLTPEQIERKKRTGSYYRKDTRTEEYKVSKDEFV